MTDYPQLVAIFETTRCVLLDFDGPVCDVFAGLPASDVAEQLRQQLADQVHDPLPAEVTTTHDPLAIIRQIAEIAPHLSQQFDTALRRAEVQAVATATLTPGAAELMAVCHAAGHPIAVVSNNSEPAIQAFLTQHELSHLVQHIQGREATNPRLMKPDPFLIHEAITALGGIPEAAALIGDSTTDIEAARAAGIRVIGYVNKPIKHQTLSGADALTTDMAELARAAVAGGFTAPSPGDPGSSTAAE